MEKIGAIFAIERGINGQSAETRRAVRQAQSLPLLADLKAYLEASLTRISRKGDLAKAIGYSLNRWEALCRFVAEKVGVRTSAVSLVRGTTSRQKTLLIEGVTVDQVRAALTPAS